MAAAARRGVRFVSVSPIRTDTDAALGTQWLALRPGTDVAVMLALVHVLITEDLCDTEFLQRCTVGADYGGGSNALGLPVLRQGRNPVGRAIPVARIADALLHPGEPYAFLGRPDCYPHFRLAYWSGGNPFHHHQDLTRLQRALRQLDTLVVHETHWTQTARHADLVIPATTTLERDDIGAGQGDLTLRGMPKVAAPPGQAREEYVTFSELAARLGVGTQFSEDRDVDGWLAHIYTEWQQRAGPELPDFKEFWAAGELALPRRQSPAGLLEAFRADLQGQPLATPSGKIELFSATVAGFGYPDCPGHAAWLEPEERLGAPRSVRFPLHLIANQPRTRLHSQQDMGEYSQQSKVGRREPLCMHPADAAARGIGDGDFVRVSNDIGSLLAGVVVTDAVRPGVVQLSTGAWFDPSAPDVATCVHGNPNVLTRDRGSSSLAQGCTGRHVLVEITRYDGPPLPIRTYDPPVY
jgi:biotin/methionine sulfoxide reductase